MGVRARLPRPGSPCDPSAPLSDRLSLGHTNEWFVSATWGRKGGAGISVVLNDKTKQ